LARTTTRGARFGKGAWRFTLMALARGMALFIGLFGTANVAATALGGQGGQNLWWIDPGFLPDVAGVALVVACSTALLSFAILPRMATWRRWVTVVACGVLGAVALQNAAEFYRAWGAGTFTPGVPVPLSGVIALVVGLVGWAAFALEPARSRVAGDLAALVGFALVVAVFPLAQVGFFGTSDYRAKADAAVVFGAMVYDNGQPSTSLADRVATAVDLYKAGLVRTLVMSGGVEPNGYDETKVMRDEAVKAGVPASAIQLDPKGLDTDATVRNTTAMFGRLGVRRVLAVSQGYHLPRVKLAYLAAGWNVRTVPAKELAPIVQTPLFVAREIPAFWVYWSRSLLTGIRGGQPAHLL
jgi:vancomycin permeability regulator SanA